MEKNVPGRQTIIKRKQEWLFKYQTKQTLEQIKITRDEEENYVVIKGSIHQEDVTALSAYLPNRIISEYVKQK